MNSHLLRAVVLLYLFPLFLCDNYIAVVVFFRHGDRTPMKFVKNDPYSDETLWPVKTGGHLTNIGKQQHYDLGQWYRKRYDGFLPRKYSPEDIYIQSTDVDRTLMSAAANLAGLYPPYQKEQNWNQNFMWQPIPIHTIPIEHDYMLYTTKQCPRHERMLQELSETRYFKEILANNSKLLKYLTERTGQEFKTLAHMESLHDTLLIEEIHNFTLPEWTKSIYPHKLHSFSLLEFSQVTFTPELARLKVGPVICELLQHFKSFTERNTTLLPPWGRKFTMLSAHDDTIINILNYFGMWDRILPPYTSSLMFELKESQNSTKYINLVYRTSEADVRMLVLPGCKQDCPFDKFVELLTPKSLCYKEWLEECYRLNDNEVESPKSCGRSY